MSRLTESRKQFLLFPKLSSSVSGVFKWNYKMRVAKIDDECCVLNNINTFDLALSANFPTRKILPGFARPVSRLFCASLSKIHESNNPEILVPKNLETNTPQKERRNCFFFHFEFTCDFKLSRSCANLQRGDWTKSEKEKGCEFGTTFDSSTSHICCRFGWHHQTTSRKHFLFNTQHEFFDLDFFARFMRFLVGISTCFPCQNFYMFFSH